MAESRDPMSLPGADVAERVIELLTAQGLRIAVAESLTGGLVAAALTSVPGASVVVSGGIVAYDTEVKHSLLGVDARLLAREGAVHPEVARQMARGVREALAVGGRRAEIGIATTGVAGPDWQDGRAPGTVYLGIADDARRRCHRTRARRRPRGDPLGHGAGVARRGHDAGRDDPGGVRIRRPARPNRSGRRRNNLREHPVTCGEVHTKAPVCHARLVATRVR